MKQAYKLVSLKHGTSFYTKAVRGIILALLSVSCSRPTHDSGYLPITEYESKTCISHNVYIYYTNPLSKFIYPKYEIFKISDNRYELILFNPFGVQAVTKIIDVPKGEEYRIGDKINENFTCED